MKQSWGQGPVHRFWQTSWEAMEMEKESSTVAITVHMEVAETMETLGMG